jgi:hypothetical protein
MQSKFAFVPSKYLCDFDADQMRVDAQAKVDAKFGADSKYAHKVRKAIAKAVA